MSKNDLCEANRPLPDGNKYHDVNNCEFGIFNHYDVFRYIGGKFETFTTIHSIVQPITRPSA